MLKRNIYKKALQTPHLSVFTSQFSLKKDNNKKNDYNLWLYNVEL